MVVRIGKSGDSGDNKLSHENHPKRPFKWPTKRNKITRIASLFLSNKSFVARPNFYVIHSFIQSAQWPKNWIQSHKIRFYLAVLSDKTFTFRLVSSFRFNRLNHLNLFIYLFFFYSDGLILFGSFTVPILFIWFDFWWWSMIIINIVVVVIIIKSLRVFFDFSVTKIDFIFAGEWGLKRIEKSYIVCEE